MVLTMQEYYKKTGLLREQLAYNDQIIDNLRNLACHPALPIPESAIAVIEYVQISVPNAVDVLEILDAYFVTWDLYFPFNRFNHMA